MDRLGGEKKPTILQDRERVRVVQRTRGIFYVIRLRPGLPHPQRNSSGTQMPTQAGGNRSSSSNVVSPDGTLTTSSAG